MDIEIKQPEGFYLKAFVNDITDDGLDVVYDRGWRKPELVKFDQCRIVISDCGVPKQHFKPGDIVDAYVRIDKNDKDEVSGWHRMKIRDIKNEFAVVETAEGGAPQINDIIPVSQCRHTAMPSKISAASVKSCAIPLNSEMFEYFQRGEETYKVLQESIPNILVKLDPTTKELVIKSFSTSAIKKVDILKDAFMSNSRQKIQMLQRQEEQKKMLSLHEPTHDAASFYVEFDVSTAFMGLAIGAQGANIHNARNIDGIKEITLDETMRDQGFCKFKIYSESAEASEQARNMLEFLSQHKMVPQNKVGQVIGKQGKTIQDIVDKSGVVRVQIGEESPEQGMVPFTFTGTREAIAYAELMVEFHLKHIIEMDEIRAEEEEIRRKMFMSRNSPFSHYNNGHPPPQYHHRPQHQNNNIGSNQQQALPSNMQNSSNMRALNGGGGGGNDRRQQNQQQAIEGVGIGGGGGGDRRMGAGGGGGGGMYRSGGGGQKSGGGGRFNQQQQNQQGVPQGGGGGGMRPPRFQQQQQPGRQSVGGGGGQQQQQRRYQGGGQQQFRSSNNQQPAFKQQRQPRGDHQQQPRDRGADVDGPSPPNRSQSPPPHALVEQLESEDTKSVEESSFNGQSSQQTDRSDKSANVVVNKYDGGGGGGGRPRTGGTGGFGAGSARSGQPVRNRRSKADEE